MRNFEFDKDRVDISAANIAGVRPNQKPLTEIQGLDEPARETLREDARSAFLPSDIEDEDPSKNSVMIAGAVLVGLLLIGGSIYAYRSTTANDAPKTVAMLPPTPQRTADQAVTPPAQTPETNNASSNAPESGTVPTTPPVRAPRPAHLRSGLASSAPAPAADSVTSATAPITSAAADPAINQPMTLTPETAPPPQQSAMQQPITAPNVTGAPAQPMPEVANNASGTMQPSGSQPDPTTAASSETSPPPASQ